MYSRAIDSCGTRKSLVERSHEEESEEKRGCQREVKSGETWCQLTESSRVFRRLVSWRRDKTPSLGTLLAFLDHHTTCLRLPRHLSLAQRHSLASSPSGSFWHTALASLIGPAARTKNKCPYVFLYFRSDLDLFKGLFPLQSELGPPFFGLVRTQAS